MKKVSVVLAAGLFLFLASSTFCMAQEFDRHGDIHRFHDHDFDRWRQGNWFHGPHGGRDGWWWIVDGAWYFYPAPVYPYPDPYLPPQIVATPAPVPGAPAYWYYCRNPQGYYPYVQACLGHWHRVAATVAVAPPAVVVQQAPVVVQQAPPTVVQQPYAVASPPPPGTPPVAIQAPLPSNPHDQDAQKLNTFAAELSQIDPNGERAVAKLKNLGKRVETFRQALFHRNYNAMDMLKNTEDLQHRISAEKGSLAKKPPAPANTQVETPGSGAAAPPPPAPGFPPTPLTAPPP